MKPSLKILHTESHCQWGGQERRIFNECQWMQQRGHHIILIAPGASPIYEKAVAAGWEVYPVPFKNLGILNDFFRVRHILKKIQPDVLNTHGNTDSKVGLTAARGLGIPCVIRSRHSTPLVHNSWYNRLLYEKFNDYVFTTANCITNQIMRDLNVSKERIFTLPSGVLPPDHLPEHEEAQQALARELNLNPDARFIGFVGRLSREKGLPSLIEAFAKIKDKLPDAHLVLVGDGNFFDPLQEMAEGKNIQDKVHLLGYRNNPWPYFRAFDCHVLASLKYEGTPQVILQAMFAGCPVIGTNTGGIPDIIVHQQTGLLTPPYNSNQLAQAILETLQDPDKAKYRAEKALEYVYAHHTMDILGEKILNLYYQKCCVENSFLYV